MTYDLVVKRTSVECSCGVTLNASRRKNASMRLAHKHREDCHNALDAPPELRGTVRLHDKREGSK